MERPGWLRELSEPPAGVQGQRTWRQAAAHILQYRERYQTTDPDRPLGPEPRQGDLERRRHHWTTRQAIQRLQDRQRTQHEQQIGRRERPPAAQPHQTHTRPLSTSR